MQITFAACGKRSALASVCTQSHCLYLKSTMSHHGIAPFSINPGKTMIPQTWHPSSQCASDFLQSIRGGFFFREASLGGFITFPSLNLHNMLIGRGSVGMAEWLG